MVFNKRRLLYFFRFKYVFYQELLEYHSVKRDKYIRRNLQYKLHPVPYVIGFSIAIPLIHAYFERTKIEKKWLDQPGKYPDIQRPALHDPIHQMGPYIWRYQGGMSADDLMTTFQYSTLNVSKEDILSLDMEKKKDNMTLLPGDMRDK
eukprot:gene3247-5690_t